MYARTTTVRGDPRAVDDGIAFARNEVWPRLERMDGCVGMSMLADREAGRCIVTAAWATEDAMRASADHFLTSSSAHQLTIDEAAHAVVELIRPALAGGPHR